MIRYDKITAKNKREIVLLKGFPCIWGKCAFCDYILDNETDEAAMTDLNHTVLAQVTGEYGALEVINSGSVFELPKATLAEIKKIADEKNIRELYFESYYSYKNRLNEIRDFFDQKIIFKCGIETFDNSFRNKVLRKGIVFASPQEVSRYFQSVCIMVGIKGQTKEMISTDVDTLLRFFEYGCINVYTDNSTAIEADSELIQWFAETYSYLDGDGYPKIDVLWNNTDFGVGGTAV